MVPAKCCHEARLSDSPLDTIFDHPGDALKGRI
jgi:hypothetical protein